MTIQASHERENYYRMPDEICDYKRLPALDYRQPGYSDRKTYLELCEYYDKFRVSLFEYDHAHYVPDKVAFPVNLAAHFECHKNDRATYECLLKFRTFYPEAPIVLFSDDGHDFTGMARYFRCHYKHESAHSGSGVKNILTDNDEINLWLSRIRHTCESQSTADWIVLLEDDVRVRGEITKNPNADLAGPANPEDFWWSPQLVAWMNANRVGVEINGLNGCGGTIFNRRAFLECIKNVPDYQKFGTLDDRLKWAPDVMLTFLFMYNGKLSRRWLDQSEESRGKLFGATAFDHQFRHFYARKWSRYYLMNTEVDAQRDIVFTACSDSIFNDQFVPFFASLTEHTHFKGGIVVIDYGLSDEHMSRLVKSGIRIIPSYGKYDIVIDRFVSMQRYMDFLGDDSKFFIHFDCDVWFHADITPAFAAGRASNTLVCTKDVWHCGFLHDCVARAEHKEYNRQRLEEVEARCGKVLQAGFIGGSRDRWATLVGYLEKLVDGGYLKNSYGSDQLVLNLAYHYLPSLFTILPIGFNTLPQWAIKDVEGRLLATEFHTDRMLGKIPGHTEPVIAVHLSSGARGKPEFRHTDFKVRHRDLYLKYLASLGPPRVP